MPITCGTPREEQNVLQDGCSFPGLLVLGTRTRTVIWIRLTLLDRSPSNSFSMCVCHFSDHKAKHHHHKDTNIGLCTLASCVFYSGQHLHVFSGLGLHHPVRPVGGRRTLRLETTLFPRHRRSIASQLPCCVSFPQVFSCLDRSRLDLSWDLGLAY